MQGVGAKIRVAVPVLVTIVIGLFGLYGLLKPVSNGCVMTYMYPTYIPISPKNGGSSAKYGLYLYHEGWKKIDFNEHLKQLSGVPVLFIPGNGGSYKQVRSLAAECDRAYQGGPLERNFYQEVYLTPEEGGADVSMSGFKLPNQYASRLDWFAVDLEGEHSAMDGRILEEHTEYVVYAIHKILDQYKQSHDTREREGAATSGSLPKSVILVGHSMGGFVARAAIIHPQLRKSAVETVLTLSTPHQSPPLALQPSLGHYFAHVNQEWKKRYGVQTTRTGHMPDPLLSNVVVVSVSGGYNDYQVRSKLESLDDIVPSTHGFMISSTGMKNVWLSMEHQAILWCNQLVVQVSHTLLSLIDSKTGQPFPETTKRLTVFSRMLRSGIPETFIWTRPSDSSYQSTHDSISDVKDPLGSQVYALSGCPSNINWNNDALERDLYIQTTSMTVLAMDGRRRWMDIQKFSSNGKTHFIFVTNLAPCFGVRLHLWPEKAKSASEEARSQRIVEVTSKLVQIPSRPAPRQVEPGSQTEQAPPSSVLQLSPEDMRGFRFLTISVAPRPSLSGRPPPAASMAIGQFFNPEDGKKELPSLLMLFSTYSQKEIFLEEDHSLAFSLSFPISLGLLPVTISLKTVGCGLRRPELPAEDAEEMDDSKLCKLRCFPPVAIAWDPTSGLHIFPNLDGEKIIVDSSPALWSSPEGSEKTTVLLLVDPHCSYKMRVAVFEPAAASRFLLLYSSQIVGFSIAVIFFALMRQAYSWDLDLPIPSMLTAVESNLRMPLPFLILAVIPIFVSLFISLLMSQPLPSFASFIIVALVCYSYANGSIILLISVSQFVFYAAATIHVFIKTRWQGWEGNFRFGFLHWFINLSSSFISLKVIRIVRLNPLLVTTLTAITLGCLVHPAFGLFILLLSHAFCCHNALCSHARRNELFDFKDEGNERTQEVALKHKGELNHNSPLEEKSSDSPNSSKSFGDTQLEIFHHRHGLFMLHLLAALMFVPSLVAWLQRIGLGHSFPWFLDSALCIGVILHGVFTAKPECNSIFSFPTIHGRELRLNFIYLLAGYYSYLSGLGLEPYKVFYAMAAVGFISFILTGLQRRRDKGEPRFGRKKHSHRH
ncbi:GPI inositol-deacylase isoform X2 [Euphorbia lathyris]|uniref:GPI inositol-deacylase isoform X2 n=1 Tax=Euphorbia lathyris TaxID=212925 RepID=UPI003313E511